MWKVCDEENGLFVWKRGRYGTTVLTVRNLEEARLANEVMGICEECGNASCRVVCERVRNVYERWWR